MAAMFTACWPEPQNRWSVSPGASTGHPAASTDSRLCSRRGPRRLWRCRLARRPRRKARSPGAPRAPAGTGHQHLGCKWCRDPVERPLPRGVRTPSIISASIVPLVAGPHQLSRVPGVRTRSARPPGPEPQPSAWNDVGIIGSFWYRSKRSTPVRLDAGVVGSGVRHGSGRRGGLGSQLARAATVRPRRPGSGSSGTSPARRRGSDHAATSLETRPAHGTALGGASSRPSSSWPRCFGHDEALGDGFTHFGVASSRCMGRQFHSGWADSLDKGIGRESRD